MSKSFCKSLLFLLFVQVAVFSQTPTILELNKPITSEIKSDATQKFQINLAENQYAKITVFQKSVDVSAKLTGFENNIVDFLNFDLEMLAEKTEIVEIVSKKAAVFTLDIVAAQRKTQGIYEISITEIRPVTDKDISIDSSRKMLLKATLLGQSRKTQEGIELAEKSLAIREKEFGKNSLEVANVYFTLGRLYFDKNDMEKTINYYLQSINIIEGLYGKESIYLRGVFRNLGKTYFDLNSYAKADAYYQQGLKILDKNVSYDTLDKADFLNNLALNQQRLGDIEKAEQLFLQTIKIKENLLGNESASLAATLMNFSFIYQDIKKSEPLLLRALAIEEKLLGPNHPNVAQTLYNLARAYRMAGDSIKAEPVARRSLEILEKSLAPNHPFTRFPLILLVTIYLTNGKYNEAEILAKRAVANAETIGTQYNPALASSLSILGDVYALKGEIEKAAELKTRANEIKYQIFSANLVIGTEKEKISYINQLREDFDKTCSFTLEFGQTSDLAKETGALLVLRQKGKALDLASDSLKTLQASLNENDKILLEKYKEKNEQFAKFILAGKGKLTEDEFKTKVKSLTEERDEIERDITKKTARIVDVNKDFSLNQIRSSMPQNAALLEFIEYLPTSLKTNVVDKSHYAVFVLKKDGEITAKDLGEKDEIDYIIKKFRQALQAPKSSNLKQFSRDLDEKILVPIRSALGDSTQLLISPDGELNLIPFEALIDKNGKYLVENYSISYLSSGRDLLRMQNPMPNNNSPMILANPAFGEFSVAQNIKTSNGKRNVNVAKSLAETYFAPLSGTEKEGQEIKKLFPNATLLTGEKANENALKQTKSPSILHIATHGFFIEPDEKSIENGNPLLRSGLALAGANNHSEKETDGIFTALESAGLNLFGTKLVVLSACGTGLGDVQTGEGVFGLRRSFVLAGSESLVISLWSVSDYIARELMVNYYKNLKQGFGRGESLRKVQLEMLKNPKRQHPFYWASFIQSGNWKELENIK